MFFRMVRGAFTRQRGKMLMIALTIALGASLATAMLNVMLDVGDKVNQELKAYGANITVTAKSSAVLNDLYELEEGQTAQGAYLKEAELGNIKTIFWAFNIVDYAPFVETDVILEDGSSATITGTWFNHFMSLPTGETLNTGVQNLRTWWDITGGRWLDEAEETDINGCMLGSALAVKLGAQIGDTITISGNDEKRDLTVVGIFEAGDTADDQIYAPMDTVQEIAGMDGLVNKIEVSALTTPDNELAVKAAKDPKSLSADQYETWYCTAYVSSICFQIQEVITDSVAAPVRQVADSEGAIMEKTELLMVLITILALVGSALGISNLVTASVMERSNEIGLMKAIGASNRAITGLILTEIVIVGIFGGIIGYFAGFGFAQIIGQSVFGSSIEMKAMVIPMVAVLVVIVTLVGSIPAVRTLLRLDPTVVLHGR
ncbi:MAG: ABC transporter permease [Oscillospiraceae bacterium]|nr:ABC transporter permease [Oscillospiraceae bacterium]